MYTHTLALYDSLPNFLGKYTEDNPLQPIKTFLQAHPEFKDTHWTIKDTAQYPQQKNGVDCELLTCAAALCIIARQEIHFDHRHMNNFRTQLAQWLIDKHKPLSCLRHTKENHSGTTKHCFYTKRFPSPTPSHHFSQGKRRETRM